MSELCDKLASLEKANDLLNQAKLQYHAYRTCEQARLLNQASLQYDAYRTGRQGSPSDPQDSAISIAASDAESHLELGRTLIENALDALRDIDMVLDPESAGKRAELILRAAQIASGMNSSAQAHTALGMIVGDETDSLDALSFACAAPLLPMIEAERHLPKVIDLLKAELLRGGRSVTLFDIDNTGGPFDTPLGEFYLSEAKGEELFDYYADHAGKLSLWKKNPSYRVDDIRALPRGIFHAWHEVLIDRLKALNYRVEIILNTEGARVIIWIPTNS